MKRIKMIFVSCMIMLGVTSVAMAETECNLLPNGSFESWGQIAKEMLPSLKDKEKAAQVGMALVLFDSDDPLVPVRWSWWYGADRSPFSFKQSTDAHSGKYALQFKGPGGQFMFSYLEVNPRSTYSYGAWVKGAGDVSVEIRGTATNTSGLLPARSGKSSTCAISAA